MKDDVTESQAAAIDLALKDIKPPVSADEDTEAPAETAANEAPIDELANTPDGLPSYLSGDPEPEPEPEEELPL